MFRRLPLLTLMSCLALTAGAILAQSPPRPMPPKLSATLAVRSAGAWKTVDRGIEYRTIGLERSEPNYSLDLKLVRFDPGEITPRIISSAEHQLKAGDAKMLAQRSGALAAINASYFDEKGKPLAFLKTSAQEINRAVSKHALYTGVFGVRDSTPFIAHRDDFESAQAQQALQSGPLLLNRGNIEPSAGTPRRYSRRAVVGVDKQQRVVVAVTDTVLGGLNFSELQELFSNPQWQIETPDLLNLDGGGSAQLYIKTRAIEEFISGVSEVPVVIGFFRRSR